MTCHRVELKVRRFRLPWPIHLSMTKRSQVIVHSGTAFVRIRLRILTINPDRMMRLSMKRWDPANS